MKFNGWPKGEVRVSRGNESFVRLLNLFHHGRQPFHTSTLAMQAIAHVAAWNDLELCLPLTRNLSFFSLCLPISSQKIKTVPASS